MATADMTAADLFRPNDRVGAWAYNVTLAVAGSVLLAVSARVSFTLPFFPAVPVTGQTFAVLLLGALLGPRLGSATVGLYLLQGAAGLPVFARGGGLAYMAGPTGGYLAGFLAAAWTVGTLARRGWDRRFLTTVAAMSLGTVLILGIGAVWLAVLLGPARALSAQVLFLPGAVLKILAAALLLPIGWKLLGRR